MWQSILKVDRLRTGDIIQTSSGHEPLFKHYAVIFYRNGIAYATHCMPKDGVVTETLEELEKKRTIYRYFRNETTKKLTDQFIEEKSKELAPYGYNFMEMNCEDYVKRIVGTYIGVDDRTTLIIIVSTIVILALVTTIILIRRR